MILPQKKNRKMPWETVGIFISGWNALAAIFLKEFFNFFLLVSFLKVSMVSAGFCQLGCRQRLWLKFLFSSSMFLWQQKKMEFSKFPLPLSSNGIVIQARRIQQHATNLITISQHYADTWHHLHLHPSSNIRQSYAISRFCHCFFGVPQREVCRPPSSSFASGFLLVVLAVLCGLFARSWCLAVKYHRSLVNVCGCHVPFVFFAFFVGSGREMNK